jgi:hypothetical protein
LEGKGRGILTGRHEIMKYRQAGRRKTDGEFLDGMNMMKEIGEGKGGGLFFHSIFGFLVFFRG